MDSPPAQRLKQLAAVWNLPAGGTPHPWFEVEFTAELQNLDHFEVYFPGQSPAGMVALLETRACNALCRRFSAEEIRQASARLQAARPD